MVAINWFDKKAKEEKELELQRSKEHASSVFEQRETPPQTSDNDLSERLLHGASVNPVSNQKSITEILAEKLGNETQEKRDKQEIEDKIAAAVGKLKNQGLVTKVQGSKDGAVNISAEEAEQLAQTRTSRFMNTNTFAQADLTAEQRKSNSGKVTSDKEAKEIALERVSAFTNKDTFAQMKVSDKRKTETLQQGNADIGAFEMIGRMVSGLNKDTNKSEEVTEESEGENDDGSV